MTLRRPNAILNRLLALVAIGAIGFNVISLAGHEPPVSAIPIQPNFVVIMVDDLDLASLTRLLDAGAMANLKTEFVQQGVTFTNSFVTNALCCPSRATLLTGLYSHNHNVRTNVFDSGTANFGDRSILATWLQAAGYYTGHVGKYLNGYGNKDLSGDGWVTVVDRQYIPPGWNDWHAMLDPYKMYDYRMNNNGVVLKHGTTADDYQTDVLSRHAVQFIADATLPARAGLPFYLQVMTAAPHVELNGVTTFLSPWQWDIRPAPRHDGSFATAAMPRPPSFNEPDVADKPAWVATLRKPMTQWDITGTTRRYRHRLESMRAVDDLIGAVVNALRTTNVLDNTVLIFTSDNGYLQGEHRMTLVEHWQAVTTLTETRLSGLLEAPSYWGVRTREEGGSGVRQALYVKYEDATHTPEFYDLATDPYQLLSLHADPLRLTEQQALANWSDLLRFCRGAQCATLEFQQ